MNKETFYTFSSKLSSSTIQAHPINLSVKEDSFGHFDQHKLTQGFYNGISLPVIFKQEYGKKAEDVLDTGWVGLFLISNNLRDVLVENGFTGWKTFAVKLLDKYGNEIQGYFGLSITGRCGKIDYTKAEIIEKRIVPNGPLGKYYKGLPVGMDEWDGSDFFLPNNNYGILVKGKVAVALKKSKITNLRFENIADIETPDFALQNK